MDTFCSQASQPAELVFASRLSKHVTTGCQQFTPIDRHFGTNRCVLPWAFLYGTTLQPAALQESLAQTLNSFPTLTGRVEPVKPATTTGLCCLKSSSSSTTTRATWQLLLCNKGVPFTVHDSEWTLQEFQDKGYMNGRKGFPFPDLSSKGALPAYMERLDPSSVLQGCAPVMSVRVTQLSGGGSILAVTAAHVVVDGRSFVDFLKAWAEAYDSSIMAPSEVAAEASAGVTANIDGIPVDRGHRKKLGEVTDRNSPCTASSPAAALPDHPKTPPAVLAQHRPCTPVESVSNRRNSGTKTVTDSNSNSTVDPLSSSAVPSPGWLSAMRSVRAAHIRLKAEGKHIQKSVRGMMSAGVAAAAGTRNGADPAACKDRRDAQTGCIADQGADGPGVQVQGKQTSQRATGVVTSSTSAVSVDTRTLATVLLHIPAAAVQRLKKAAGVLCQSGQYISSNDAVSALVWLLMCYLRNRPMPGQDRPADMQDSYLGLAIDTRTTATTGAAEAAETGGASVSADDFIKSSKTSSRGAAAKAVCTHNNNSTAKRPSFQGTVQNQQQLEAAALPKTYFGNAAWYLTIRSCNAAGRPIYNQKHKLPVPWTPDLMPQDLEQICSDHKFLIRSLAAGSMRIRDAVHAMRSDERFAVKMMQQVEKNVTAPLSSQVSNLAGFVRKLDGFVTSWQFGFWEVKFGGQEVLGFQGFVHPIPPYFSVVVPASPNSSAADIATTYSSTASSADVTAAAAEDAGHEPSSSSSSDSSGVLVWLTVPECLVPVMTASPVVKLLVPDADWLSGV